MKSTTKMPFFTGKMKFLSHKKNNYGQLVSYFKIHNPEPFLAFQRTTNDNSLIESPCLDKGVLCTLKFPFFKTDDGEYILTVKKFNVHSDYFNELQKGKDYNLTIDLKPYNFESKQMRGYSAVVLNYN
jgi:hypothetical protein